MRKFFVGGNWKANPKTIEEAKSLISAFNNAKVTVRADVVIAAPAIFLPLVKGSLRQDWHVAAENVFDKPNGAYTGEVTAPMIKSLGIDWTILGHSERRDILGEDDDFLVSKAKFALENDIKIIYCCGEHLEEREAGKAKEFVGAQIEKMINAIPNGKWNDVVIAYEPIWAIGTGKVALKEDAQEMCASIRAIISDHVSSEIANSVRILYGGSVKPDNAEELAKMPDVDGFLVGGASLQPSFVDIVRACDIESNGTSKCCLII